MKEKSIQDIEKKIREDIEKTGFVSELKVVSTLLENKWHPEHSYTYEDKDENISREIDVITYKPITDKNCTVGINLIIEIKKSESPWVVFTTQKKATLSWATNLFIAGRSWILKKKYGTYESKLNVINSLNVQENCLRKDSLRVGKAFHELNKNPSDKSKIYGALISSGKAAKYYRDLNYNESESIYKSGDYTSIILFLPLVVLDGILFEVYNDSKGEIKIEKKDFIPVEMFYSSPKYKSLENQFGVTFAPDLITIDYLTEYIKKIELWQTGLLNAALKNLGNGS